MREWDDLTDSERIHAIMQHVMGWECFISWDDYLKKYGEQEHALGAGAMYVTPTHVAFYDTDHLPNVWRVFSPDHEQLTVFDPLHDMHDAMQIAEKMVIPSKDFVLRILAGLATPEMICKSAYQMVSKEG